MTGGVIVMASALNSKWHSKISMWLYKVIADVVVIYYYVKKMAELEEVKKSKNQVDLTLVEIYLRHQKFPDGTSTKGDKTNIRRACKKFSVANGQLIHKGNWLVVTDKQRRIDITHDVHQGLGNSVKAVAMSSHLERTSTYQKVSSRFYSYTIVNDVADYIKCCDNCQKHLSMPKKVKEELNNTAVPSEVMKQIGVDICCLRSVDEFEYLIYQSVINLHQQLLSFFMSLFAGMAVLLSR